MQVVDRNDYPQNNRDLGPLQARVAKSPTNESLIVPIVRNLNELPESARGGAVAIGNFDGVHLGHLRIVRRLLERANEVNGPAIVFTFDPHPVRILRPAECPPPLTWTKRKAQLLSRYGVYKIVAYPTDEALLGLSAREFFDAIVIKALDAKAMVEGPNFFFGHKREGNVDLLREFTSSAGISLDVVEPYKLDDQMISSSAIRELIAEGDVALAAKMLSSPYRIRGMVTHGAGRGAKLGFPTANLEAVDTLLPSLGVYAGKAWLDSEPHLAAIHLGPNPTFGEGATKVEIHLIDFHEPIYGQPLEVEFLSKIRDVVTFDSQDALVKQLQKDVEQTRKLVTGTIE